MLNKISLAINCSDKKMLTTKDRCYKYHEGVFNVNFKVNFAKQKDLDL